VSSTGARALEERARLLEMEATLQRATLAATFEKWQERRLLALAASVASLGWRLMAMPKVRWLVAAGILSRLKGRSRHA
jgi:hypothetical protein